MILDTRRIAELLSSPGDPWDSRRARRFLARTHLGRRAGARYYTTPQLLADLQPELWRTLLAQHDLRPDPDDLTGSP